MKTTQMKSELVETLKKNVNHFAICSQTYYHTIFLFNVVKLKNKKEDTKSVYTIPVRIKDHKQSPSRNNDFFDEKLEKISKIEYLKISSLQMPNKEKLDLVVCFFLAHKIYESKILSLPYLMQYFGIKKYFEEYILQLEIYFLVLLKYKIQHILPSHETLFACQVWDSYMQNIDHSCVDVKFGIKQIIEESKRVFLTSNSINEMKIKPEFQNIENQQNFEALTKNIQNIVHNEALYTYFIKKSEKENSKNLHLMKRVALAIIYVTILQQSSLVFNKKYNLDQKTERTRGRFLDFVFNDFLALNYSITLKEIEDEIDVCIQILQEINRKMVQNSDRKKSKIYLISNLDQVKQNKIVQFLLGVKQKTVFQQFHLRFQKNEENKKQKNVRKDNSSLKSEIHNSIKSQNIFSSTKENQPINQISKNIKNKNQETKQSYLEFTNSLQKDFNKNSNIKNLTSNKNLSKKTKIQSKQRPKYKVSSFNLGDV